MITVPTTELVGLLTDTIPFASPDKDDDVLYTVRIDWDGEMLHASATDRFHIGWSRWHPDDDPDVDSQDDLFTVWGGDDEPWTAVIGVDDAKDAVRMFKLAAKEGQAPLTVTLDGGQLRVSRSRETGHSAITHVMRDAATDNHVDVRDLFDHLPEPAEVDELAFTARYLADFAKVRVRGQMQMTFAGPDRAVRIQIGERFTGAINPVRIGSERLAPAA